MALARLAPLNMIKLRKIKQQNVLDILELSFANKVFSAQLFESKFNQF